MSKLQLDNKQLILPEATRDTVIIDQEQFGPTVLKRHSDINSFIQALSECRPRCLMFSEIPFPFDLEPQTLSISDGQGFVHSVIFTVGAAGAKEALRGLHNLLSTSQIETGMGTIEIAPSGERRHIFLANSLVGNQSAEALRDRTYQAWLRVANALPIDSARICYLSAADKMLINVKSGFDEYILVSTPQRGTPSIESVLTALVHKQISGDASWVSDILNSKKTIPNLQWGP